MQNHHGVSDAPSAILIGRVGDFKALFATFRYFKPFFAVDFFTMPAAIKVFFEYLLEDFFSPQVAHRMPDDFNPVVFFECLVITFIHRFINVVAVNQSHHVAESVNNKVGFPVAGFHCSAQISLVRFLKFPINHGDKTADAVFHNIVMHAFLHQLDGVFLSDGARYKNKWNIPAAFFQN